MDARRATGNNAAGSEEEDFTVVQAFGVCWVSTCRL